ESVDHGGEGQAREDEGDEQDDDGRDDDGRPSGEGFAGGGGRRNGQGQGDRREPAHPAPGHERGVADIQRSGIGVLLAAPAFEEGAQQQPGEADGDDDCGDDEPHAGGSAEVRVLGFDDHAQIEPDESEGDAGDEHLEDLPGRGLGHALGGVALDVAAPDLEGGDDDGDDPAGVEVLGDEVDAEGQHEHEGGAGDRVVDLLHHRPDDEDDDEADRDRDHSGDEEGQDQFGE